MSKTIITVCKCDVCKEQCNEKTASKQLDIIFCTEQTEGRAVKPYLCRNNVDLCDGCYQKVLNGNYIFAHGAMGYNEYYFKEKTNG